MLQEEERRRAERAKRFAPRAASFEACNPWLVGPGRVEMIRISIIDGQCQDKEAPEASDEAFLEAAGDVSFICIYT